LKVAIISDVHGNLTALETVLPAIRKEADRVVCLGDVAATGPQPHETIALLKELDLPCVLGNTDESLWKGAPDEFNRKGMSTDEVRRMKALDEWTRFQITNTDREGLSTFKPTITVRAADLAILCYHGSPRSNTEGILPTTSDDELARVFSKREANIFAGGHTHRQMVRRWRNSIVVNPGSVGLPFEQYGDGTTKNPAWAEYVMLTLGERELNVELRRVRYDLSKLTDAVRKSRMPDPEWWLADWF